MVKVSQEDYDAALADGDLLDPFRTLLYLLTQT